ncbi:hypothetical protein [Knoellia aerolata]|uniref:Uncharacterized protein n=1 Tax=Knoellia aerolata DSM 18566 TaxID=1385519 RepID=A0A0A0JMS4_9MICO|nr:hypothetical protein [Knoellia aerolata]KGN37999.1 hypothetical protein N801_00320 [Knoellia aerolata DSM 18566]
MDTQDGWRRCNVCEGIFFMDSPGQSCVGGAMHRWPTSAEYKAPWGDVEADCQAGWGRCNKCGGLCFTGNPGVCFDQAPHTYDEFDATYNVPFGGQPECETGWRWCSKCQRLWHLPHQGSSGTACFAGGEHDPAGSFEYVLPQVDLAVQKDWSWCSVCQGLIRFGPFEGAGCVDGADHSPNNSYRVAYGGQRAHDQQGWCFCRRCHRLAFSAEGGVCALGGAHDFTDTLPYTLPVDDVPDAQPGWRWCPKCQTLSYTGFAVGRCPAGDLHDHASSGAYSVWPDSLDQGQPGWRRCVRCRSLVLSSVTDGPCRDGASHDVTGSPAYQAFEGGVDFGQEGSFAWCHRCQVLVHGGPSFTGVCVDGAPHDITESWVYGIPRDDPPEGAEPGWLICARCAQLFSPDTDAGPGLCSDAAGHDATGSPALFVAVLPPPPPVVALPGLILTESAAAVVVDGTGFPASTAVEVSFIVGGATTVTPVDSDAAGAFHLERSPAVPAPDGGGLVLAKAEPDTVASGRLKSFVPASAGAPGAPGGGP